MSLNPSVLRAMKDAGASLEVILAAVEAQAALDDQRRERLREGNAFRQRKRRHGVSQRDRRDPPNDNNSNPPFPPQSANADCSAPPSFSDRIVAAWNAPGCFRKAQALRGGRLKKLQSRRREFDEETLLKGIRCLSTSDWHTGRSGDWQANLGWFLHSEENVNKALEFNDPGERKQLTPEDQAAQLDKRIATYRMLGRDSEADEMESQAKALRREAA